jgi:hypothetical protein
MATFDHRLADTRDLHYDHSAAGGGKLQATLDMRMEKCLAQFAPQLYQIDPIVAAYFITGKTFE